MDKVARTNYAWIIGILIVLLIAVVSIKFPLPSRLEELVTFSATLSSLLLAIIAIFQSMIYAAAANKDKAVASEVNERTFNLLEQVGSQLSPLTKSVAELNDKIQNSQFEKTNGSQNPPEAVQQDIRRFIPALIATSSPAGLFAILLAIKANEKGRPINLAGMLDKNLAWFVYGFISSLGAANWLSYSAADAGVFINAMSNDLRSFYGEIEERFLEKASSEESSRREWDRVKALWGI